MYIHILLCMLENSRDIIFGKENIEKRRGQIGGGGSYVVLLGNNSLLCNILQNQLVPSPYSSSS